MTTGSWCDGSCTSAAWAFTPDTLAGQYVDCQTGRALFEQQFAELVVQPLLDDGLELLVDQVYEIGMQEFQAAMNPESADNSAADGVFTKGPGK